MNGAPPTSVDPPSWWELSGRARDDALLDAARSGDRRAMSELVASLTPLVWHVARGSGLGRETAEDVVQTVWLTLFSQLDRLDDPRALAGWLITTTRREARRSLGRRLMPLTDELAEVLVDPRPGPEADALRADRDRQIWRAFAKLPQRCQDLLRLTVLAGRAEYRAVAEALHMPRGSVGPTRGRCLHTLRQLLDAEEATPTTSYRQVEAVKEPVPVAGPRPLTAREELEYALRARSGDPAALDDVIRDLRTRFGQAPNRDAALIAVQLAEALSTRYEQRHDPADLHRARAALTRVPRANAAPELRHRIRQLERRTAAAPPAREKRRGRFGAFLDFFGLAPPPPGNPISGDAQVLAAVEDTAAAYGEVLREGGLVLAEWDAAARHVGDRT